MPFSGISLHSLSLRIGTIRDHVAHMNSRLTLRSPHSKRFVSLLWGPYKQLLKQTTHMAPNTQLITASILSIGGLILLFCGIFIDPQGQIHETLLVAFGETATFAGALFGIDYTYRKRNNHNDGTERS